MLSKYFVFIQFKKVMNKSFYYCYWATYNICPYFINNYIILFNLIITNTENFYVSSNTSAVSCVCVRVKLSLTIVLYALEHKTKQSVTHSYHTTRPHGSSMKGISM